MSVVDAVLHLPRSARMIGIRISMRISVTGSPRCVPTSLRPHKLHGCPPNPGCAQPYGTNAGPI
jgi:hypothetical protein